MNGAARSLGFAAALGAVATPLPAQGSLRIVCEPQEVVFGQPFALEVVRSWPLGHEPEPFDDALLLPLAVELQTSRVDAGRDAFVETRRYRAVAYALGALRLPPLAVRSRAPDGAVATATADIPVLAVASCLPEPAGDVEWPGDVRDARPSGLGQGILEAVVAAVLGIAGLALWFGRRRTHVRTAEDAAALRAAIAALPLPAESDPAAVTAFYVELARLVRSRVGTRLQRRVDARTTEELVALAAAVRAELGASLAPCDRVKFAAARPGAAAHAEAKALALAFVDASAAGDRQ